MATDLLAFFDAEDGKVKLGYHLRKNRFSSDMDQTGTWQEMIKEILLRLECLEVDQVGVWEDVRKRLESIECKLEDGEVKRSGSPSA